MREFTDEKENGLSIFRKNNHREIVSSAPKKIKN